MQETELKLAAWPELMHAFNEVKGQASTSPRSTILVSGALVENVLERLLRAFLIESTALNSLLSRGTAPLGTFAARCWAAEAMGLVTTREAECLKIIRDIRNEYAHRLGSDINEQSVKDRLNNFVDKFPPVWSHLKDES